MVKTATSQNGDRILNSWSGCPLGTQCFYLVIYWVVTPTMKMIAVLHTLSVSINS